MLVVSSTSSSSSSSSSQGWAMSTADSLGFPVLGSSTKEKKIVTQDLMIRACALGFLPLSFSSNLGGKIIFLELRVGKWWIFASYYRNLHKLHKSKVSFKTQYIRNN